MHIFIIRGIIITLFSWLTATCLYAQNCAYYPADCPDEAGINSAKYTTDGLLPKEIEMQNRVRDATTTMMLQASKQLHWQVAELNEVSGTGPLQAGATPYDNRSPRMFSSIWQFIVDKDSLEAWKNWLENYQNNITGNLSGYTNKATDIANSPLYKAYSDSIDDYINKSADYAEKHKLEGIAMTDSKGYKHLQSKMNDFIDKRTKLMQPAEGSYVNTDDELKSQTLHFREAATVRILFSVNYGAAAVKSSDEDIASDYKLPGVFIAKNVRVVAPAPTANIDDLGRGKHFMAILLGKWNSKLNQYNGYNAQFKVLPGQDDEHGLKKIKSDKIQTISIYIIGNTSNIEKVLPFIIISTLNDLITGN